MTAESLLHSDLTDQTIRAFYHVHNSLGFGFLEKVYERALMRTLQKAGLIVERQVPIDVWFEGESVGVYFADLVVNGRLILELKTSDAIAAADEAQLLNYLRATSVEVGLVLNFGEKPSFRRKLMTNDRKPHLKTRDDAQTKP